jgi:hypothetical protein
MKIYKMLVHYGAMFTIPTAIALYFYNPRTEDQKRQQLVRSVRTIR